MEVVFDMLSGTSVLFCTNKKSHYYDAENEVRYGYELSNVASNHKRVPQNKLETLKISICHLNKGIKGLVHHFLQTV
jgi:cytochrome c